MAAGFPGRHDMGMSSPERAATFFISYIDDDLAWAEWVAATVEECGASAALRAWDSTPGT
ncbi:toll/interleukin-1 receptor domain-containing protein [Frankia gtarii]|uniref:toll/interleukin-1 receptor domain-containing protein n=1 Tax=Frankia gtarii TaxID=2950102 RepID=UPI0021BFC7B1|nr:toll/interleukin-1 receptor domain-containing protein [Frankia gtarii]